MGIIQRQALRNTVITFAGNFLGGITRLLMPALNVSPTYFGLLTLIDFISAVFVTVFTLGFDQVMIKMFPRFRNEENGHHGFLMLGIFISLLGIAVSFVLFYFLGDYFLKEDTDVSLFRKFSFLVFPLIFCRIIFLNIDSYVRMLFNTVIGVFLESFLSKIVILFSLVAFAAAWVDVDGLVYIYSFSFCIPGIVVIFYAISKTKKITLPAGELVTKQNRSEIIRLGTYGLLIGASSSIVIYIDSFMIGRMISLDAVAYYVFFALAARFILIPGRSIHRIATVVLAEAWNQNDQTTVLDVYKKSCVNQLLIGTYLLGIGYISIAPVLSLSPAYGEYLPYTILFLILGFGFLVEMATGVNMAIISTSVHFAYNTYFNIAMAVLVFTLNYLLIPDFQLIGCAIASMASMVVVNFMRWFLLYKKYKLQPFDFAFVKVLLLAIVFLGICVFTDYDAPAWIKLAVNFFLLTVSFWGIVIVFNLSGDVTGWLKKMKAKYL